MCKCYKCTNKQCPSRSRITMKTETLIDYTTSKLSVHLVPASEIRPHENFDYRYMIALASDIVVSGLMAKPVVVDAKTRTLLDGHHRFAALGRYLAAPLIPCVLVDYQSDETITVSTWRLNESVTKGDVIEASRTRSLMPIKTTKHSFGREIGSFEFDIRSLFNPNPSMRSLYSIPSALDSRQHGEMTITN